MTSIREILESKEESKIIPFNLNDGTNMALNYLDNLFANLKYNAINEGINYEDIIVNIIPYELIPTNTDDFTEGDVNIIISGYKYKERHYNSKFNPVDSDFISFKVNYNLFLELLKDRGYSFSKYPDFKSLWDKRTPSDTQEGSMNIYLNENLVRGRR